MSMSFVVVPVGGGTEDVCASASLSMVWKNLTMVGLLLGSSTWMCACLKKEFFWYQGEVDISTNERGCEVDVLERS